MLSEEALVLLAAAVAVALLILGVLELIVPTRPRHPKQPPTFVRDPWRRARRPPTAARSATIARRAAPAAETIALPAPRSVEPPPVAAEPRPAPEPVIDFPLSAERERMPAPVQPLAPDVEPEPGPAMKAGPDAAETPPEPVTALAPIPEPDPVAASEPAVAPSLSPIERCYALYEAQRFDEVVADGLAALEATSSGPRVREPEDVARLWGVVGLARRALGQYDAARVALEEAIAAASEGERPSWERHLAALVLQASRELQARAEYPSAGGAERVDAARSAIAWLEGGLALVPEDEVMREAARSARDMLWSTYERVAMEQMQRQDYRSCRPLLEQALASCPPDSLATFRELLSGTYSGMVGQLTAEALRQMREGAEAEALTALDQAEALLGAISQDGLPERRRQELERRLWWSYTKVGARWLEGGACEQALPPLLHALRFASVGAQRIEETRRPLLRALAGLVEAIERLIASGDPDEARGLCDRLWAFIDEALEHGVTKEELGETLERAHELRGRLEGSSA